MMSVDCQYPVAIYQPSLLIVLYMMNITTTWFVLHADN